MTTEQKKKVAEELLDIQIGIPPENIQKVANKLQQVLADEQVLYAKIRNYHWNVEARSFMELHTFYERLYNELAEAIDEIAERIRQLGHFAQGKLEDSLKQTSLLEGEYTSIPKTQLQNLLDDNLTIIRSLRNDIEVFDDKYNDAGTADLATGLLRKHEQWAWFLRSYLTE